MVIHGDPLNRSPRWGTAALVCLLVSQLGCAAKKQVAFSHAGTVYASSLDVLLTRSETAAVDATSERLLQDDELSNQTIASYKRLSDIDEARLEITARLRKHARLLASYFVALDDLANSKAPEQAEQSMNEIAEQLNALGNHLRQSPLIANTAVVSKTANFAVGQIRNKMLREELARRHGALDRELATEEALITALGKAIQHDVAVAREIREQRLVVDPLLATAPVRDPDSWITTRRQTLLASKQIAELDTATEAVQKLRAAFDDLRSGENKTTIQSLLNDVEGMLSSATTK